MRKGALQGKQPTNHTQTYLLEKPTVTITSERADITVTGFPYRIWLETGKIYIEKTVLTRGSIFHNEKEVEMDKSACEIAWEEGDSFYFLQGSITVYQNDLVVELPEESRRRSPTTMTKGGDRHPSPYSRQGEYQPQNGRFTAQDVIQRNGVYPETLNRYRYCWGESCWASGFGWNDTLCYIR